MSVQDESVTIAEMLRLKREASAAIGDALRGFTEATGLVVDAVHVRCIDTTAMADQRRNCDYRVELRVELP